MNDPVVLSYGDALLRSSDLQILQSDTGWLNDRIIGYVFESANISFVPNPLKNHTESCIDLHSKSLFCNLRTIYSHYSLLA